ncbi:NAD kinase 2 [Caldalkalibacillus thermarum]|uniref:NAD kinase n=1 Tax=Caldalkalibacillus thermarum TaxID=296745 RepID=UPI001669DF95|nr:NAD kinase [Caldalkalibacillus thermarum]GGK12428.1 NAD kinase 2 [Caldalkalibacillus thermarum]
MSRRKVFFYYREDDQSQRAAQHIKERSQAYGFTILNTHHDADIICSIGSDGTFLQAVRHTGFRTNSLYVGIHLENLGFYCDFSAKKIEDLFEAMDKEMLQVRRYPVIQSTINETSSFYCLNECSIRSSILKTFVMEVYIDGEYFETFRGDGMVIATPTGSTGYNKSVGGAVVDPKLPCFQVSEISSINNNDFRTLGSSFILGEDRQLTLKITHEGLQHPLVGMDNEAINFSAIRQVDVKLADFRIKTLKMKSNSFWDKVKRRFL